MSNQLYDGRIAAWVQAWQCVQTAQKLRHRATANHKDAAARYELHGEADRFLAEARIYTDLASVTDATVGIPAGMIIQHNYEVEMEASREYNREMSTAFFETFGERKSEKRCHDCQAVLEPLTACRLPNAAKDGTIDLCQEHYDQRTKHPEN